MIETAIAQLTNQENLDFTMSQQVITEIMKGQASDAQIGSFLTALAIKKATIDEIAGAATAMRSQALRWKRARCAIIRMARWPPMRWATRAAWGSPTCRAFPRGATCNWAMTWEKAVWSLLMTICWRAIMASVLW